MENRLVTRYLTKSKDDVDENQRRVEAVFEDLATSRPRRVVVLLSSGVFGTLIHQCLVGLIESQLNGLRTMSEICVQASELALLQPVSEHYLRMIVPTELEKCGQICGLIDLEQRAFSDKGDLGKQGCGPGQK